MSHTPGPWECNLASHPSDQVFAAGVIVADCKWTNHTPLQREDNARLIASAPELLAALARCLAHFENIRNPDADPFDSPLMAQARAAIARAKGEA